jgi:hypothetical protein
MSTPKNYARFLKAVEQTSKSASKGPLNSAAIASDKTLGLQKASDLLSYRNYLAKARAWKASQKASTLDFDREVQAQASQALADTRDLAAAVLRVTSQMKHAGQLDRALNSWIAGLEGSGPVQITDLWNGLVNDPSTRQLLTKHGLTDALFSPVNEGMTKLGGRVFARGSKLSAEIKFAGTDQVQNASFSAAATGPLRSLDDLLKRGQFERLVEHFNSAGAASIPLIQPAAGDLEMPDVILAGAVQSVQMVAQHHRNLQDTGLATYAGDGPIAAYVVIALVVALIGYGMAAATCPDGPDHNAAECTVGIILAVLGGLALVGLLGLWAYALGTAGNTLGLVVLFTLVLAVGSEITSH